ncbi:AMP-dependent synthetase and ligase domain protein [Mycobacterium avium subsp. avium 2285 (R)]|nr:AMP-dependent synthetase and ligase domain protein [Mycobacterium avium subsp. avium 2285 (R)]
MFPERLAIGGGAWAQFNCGNRNLAQPLIRHGRDGGICHRRVRTQCADDRLRGHLETAAHDHVVRAAVDVEETIFIEMP